MCLYRILFRTNRMSIHGFGFYVVFFLLIIMHHIRRISKNHFEVGFVCIQRDMEEEPSSSSWFGLGLHLCFPLFLASTIRYIALNIQSSFLVECWMFAAGCYDSIFDIKMGFIKVTHIWCEVQVKRLYIVEMSGIDTVFRHHFTIFKWFFLKITRDALK